MSHALIDQGVAEGKPFPLGAVCTADGVNFSVYSKNATGVELLLFDHLDDAHPLARSFASRNTTHVVAKLRQAWQLVKEAAAI
jgi:pullulanase/glycogen debranching enzyme